MELEHGIFDVKLHELKREYVRMQSRLRLFQGKDLEQVHRERERLQEEYQAQDRLLEETVRSCRCRTMARLAELQRDYGRQAEELLQTGLTAGQQRTGPGGGRDALCGVCNGFCDPDYEVCDDHRPERHGTSDPGG